MIVKYKESEKVLKRVNEKINSYADVFDFDLKMKEKEKKYEGIIEELNKLKNKAHCDLEKERELLANEKKEKEKLAEETNKLRETLEKYQNILLSKALENNSTASESAITRQLTGQSRISTCEPLRASQINTPNPEPFKITIDTHVIHKENSIPSITTAFHNAPSNPIQAQTYDTRLLTPMSPYSGSRVATIRPLSPAPVSPSHSRVPRPL
jgi:chromosome segregation ATPase